MFQTRYFLGFLLIVTGLWLPLASQAFVVRSGTDVNFNQSDQMNGTTYAAGQQITVDTPLPGDLICVGQDIFINQPVAGDIICAAENLMIKADIGGSVRLIGSQINLSGQVERNIMLFGSDLVIDSHTEIKGETLLAGRFLDSRGRYGQDFHGAVSQAKLYGEYAGPVNLMVGDYGDQAGLQINSGAKLEQGLVYRSNLTAQIDPAAEIKGEIVKKDLPAKYQPDKKAAVSGWLWTRLLKLFMLLATGLVIISLWPKLGDNLAKIAKQQPVKLVLKGLLVLIVMPALVFLAALTIIGLPLAAIILVIWLILLYSAKLVIGYWLGRQILPQIKNNIWPFLVGTTILMAVIYVPVIGWLVGVIVTWWGIGAIWQMIKQQFSSIK